MSFKNRIGLFLTALVIFISCFGIVPKIIADETVDNLNRQIEDYSRKLVELSKSKDTLANQIKIFTSQIELTLLKINQTESQIRQLESDIQTLSQQIGKLDISLNRLSSIYLEQVSQNYKFVKIYSPLSIVLSSGSFNNSLEQYKYLIYSQKHNQEILVSMETTRTNYDIQKTSKEQKQKELETMQQKLSEQQANLARQKANKSNLLEVTKNDETKYQSLKKAAEDELNSLLKAKFVGKREVKKGEPIGTMGNTGYSFGDHLHFGLYDLKENDLSSWVYTNDIDSSEYLKNHIWPMSEPFEITQGRGVTKYSYLYADHFHHGVDFVADNKTIKAVNDGVAYFFRNSGSSLGNHVKIFHSDGKMSLYLHLQ